MSTDNKQSLPAITLAAIGVVYGDIGTSPLYTLRECLSGQFGFGVERDAVFGFLSLIFWLLILTVSLKYITFVMRADNAGEGGILTLMSLAGRNTSARATYRRQLLLWRGGDYACHLGDVGDRGAGNYRPGPGYVGGPHIHHRSDAAICHSKARYQHGR